VERATRGKMAQNLSGRGGQARRWAQSSAERGRALGVNVVAAAAAAFSDKSGVYGAILCVATFVRLGGGRKQT